MWKVGGGVTREVCVKEMEKEQVVVVELMVVVDA